MLFRSGTINELQSLWGNDNPSTQKYFIRGMKNSTIEFWTIEDEDNSELVGELYIFWNSEDKDEADGRNRAYLCAFRIREDYQGKGLGSTLMKGVLKRVKEKGFCEVTIGVESNAERLIMMYNSWGFSKLIKFKNVDCHNRDKKGKPRIQDIPIALYLKELR